MAEHSKIQWTTHTFNPWRGCVEVAEGCRNCYAAKQALRNPATLGTWGTAANGGTRIVAAESSWRDVARWHGRILEWQRQLDDQYERGAVEDRAAGYHGPASEPPRAARERVFAGSMCDVFEQWNGWVLNSRNEVIADCRDCGHTGVIGTGREGGNCCMRCKSGAITTGTLCGTRRRLFELIDATPMFDWLLLTKRPENIRNHLAMVAEPEKHGTCTQESRPPRLRRNLWLGTSVANQKDADKNVPALLGCRDLASVLFLSVEPLVDTVDLSEYLIGRRGFFGNVPALEAGGKVYPKRPGIDWVIVGGESGAKSRPCDVAWVRSVVRQCRAAGVPVFVKQLGAHVVDHDTTSATHFADDQCWPDGTTVEHHRVRLRDAKGGDLSEWPADLRVREFPDATVANEIGSHEHARTS